MIEVGTLITAYHKGFHRVLKITPEIKDHPGYAHMPPDKRTQPAQVEYQQVYTAEGKPIKGQVRSCAIDFCKPVTLLTVGALIAKHEDIIVQLRKMIETPPESDMARRAKQRPANYSKLSGREQWEIDKGLGILDWEGD
jgi:hypothetical protein